MIFSLIISAFFMLSVVSGLQINIQSIKTNDLVVRDTVQQHYELIVDSVLGQHNEDLLSRLSNIIKNPHDLYSTLQPEAEIIFGSQAINIQDICVTQMPGMIANQIHELSNTIYTSIETIVSGSWQLSDTELRQFILSAISKGYNEAGVIEELGHALEVINMDMADDLVRVLEKFDMTGKIRSSVISCQVMFEQDAIDELNKSEHALSEEVLVAVISLNKEVSKSEVAVTSRGFLDTFIAQLSTDLQAQLYNEVYSMAKSVYEDLAFSA